jgi:anti-sigma regulatory factor (Ser/Thr protein kinase)
MNAHIAMFPARLGELRRVLAFLEAFCAASGIARTACLRVNLALEELFINTVKHGHGGDCDAPVWISLSATDSAVTLAYEDTAPPFNPYARKLEDPAEAALEMRRIGGLGVALTRELADTHDYAYLFGRNRIRLVLSH